MPALSTPSHAIPTATHSFPSDTFLSRAVDGLRLLQARRLNLEFTPEHNQLLARHAPAQPQAPLKPAA